MVVYNSGNKLLGALKGTKNLLLLRAPVEQDSPLLCLRWLDYNQVLRQQPQRGTSQALSRAVGLAI